MIAAVLEHSLLLFVGGFIFGVSLFSVIPFGLVKLTIRQAIVLFISIAILFWASFLLPRVIIFSDILTVDPLTYIGISAFSYIIFLAGLVVDYLFTRWYLRRKRPPQ